MAGLRRTLDELRRYQHKLKGLLAKEAGSRQPPDIARSHLSETVGFGANPGALRMLSHVPPQLPEGLPAGAPLVVVLHGCSQSAAGYDAATGWSVLAERLGFAVLFPEQTRDNNPNLCFNWFQPADIARDHGEAASIKQMIVQMIATHGLDPRRVTICGLSAGGAMAAVMLATYPELFAAGAIIAGLPYGCAGNVQQAFEAMMQGRSRSAADWAALVRAASPHAGPWPKISIWHGDADKTVLPVNADELVKQWTEIHRLGLRPTIVAERDGFPYRAWTGDDGEILVDSITVTGMGHGTPIAPGATGIGQPAPFVLDVGISSTTHLARAWGLAARQPFAATARPADLPLAVPVAPTKRATTGQAAEAPRPTTGRAAFDPRTVIEDALRAAGLLRD